MIITRAPFRISFFGGGSDLPAFYQRATGAVLSATIDRYMYLSVHPHFDGRTILVKYAQTERVERPADLRHPIVRRALERLGIAGGIEITSTADLPAGTGLGSSSAFAVALLHALYAYQGRAVGPTRLAREAAEIEIVDLDEPVGKQDAYASAHGGLNAIRFFTDDSVDVAPVALAAGPRQTLERALMLFYTGAQRSAGAVLAAQRHALEHDANKQATVARMVELAYRGRALIEDGDVEAFGRLLDDGWQLKRSLTTQVSTPQIDQMYAAAMAAGAWGGKLLGAGAGGFLLVAAENAVHPAVRSALAGYRELAVRFERGGSKLVYLGDDPVRDDAIDPDSEAPR
ncbi:MAG: GHMP kinase [Myxococcales bacterium]|nr:GHMP kinase [Myxococcales bacterium]